MFQRGHAISMPPHQWQLYLEAICSPVVHPSVLLPFHSSTQGWTDTKVVKGQGHYELTLHIFKLLPNNSYHNYEITSDKCQIQYNDEVMTFFASQWITVTLNCPFTNLHKCYPIQSMLCCFNMGLNIVWQLCSAPFRLVCLLYYLFVLLTNR